jgi:hypothetical protein
VLEVKVELSQPFSTEMLGVAGTALGAAVPKAYGLVQLFSVMVRE